MAKLTAEKIKGIILGHAVADALGVPVEFSSREALDRSPVTDMTGYGTYNMPAGAWSDDTTMELCALESLAKGNLDLDDIMQNFGKWVYKGEFTPTGKLFDIGNACRSAIFNYFERHADTAHCGLTEASSNGNGSLMRIIPFALYGYCRQEDVRYLAEVGSALTHAHLRSKIACYVYSLIIVKMLDNPSKDVIGEAISEAKNYYGSSEEWAYYEPLFSIAVRERDTIKSTGYVVDSLEAALWCLLTTNSYKECVLKAVNLGGDTDTVAAIAGGLAGALYGLDAIPKEWLDTLLKRDYIEELCEKAAKAWE